VKNKENAVIHMYHNRNEIYPFYAIKKSKFLGLSLVFAILRQNWQQSQQNPGSSILCNEVLKTALRVLSSLPMMSLANTTSTDIGQSTLNQVNEFLMSSMNPSNIGGDQGKYACIRM
jgi:hypothetical protein